MILIWNVDFRQFYNSDTDALLSIDLCLERFCMLHFQYFVLTKTTWWGWYLIEKKSPRIATVRPWRGLTLMKGHPDSQYAKWKAHI